MKTIIVVYLNSYSSEERYAKRYVFNTDDDVKVGDILNSPKYDNNMKVVKVLAKVKKYFNKETGRLSNLYFSTMQFTIRELKIGEENKDVIYATKV